MNTQQIAVREELSLSGKKVIFISAPIQHEFKSLAICPAFYSCGDRVKGEISLIHKRTGKKILSVPETQEPLVRIFAQRFERRFPEIADMNYTDLQASVTLRKKAEHYRDCWEMYLYRKSWKDHFERDTQQEKG